MLHNVQVNRIQGLKLYMYLIAFWENYIKVDNSFRYESASTEQALLSLKSYAPERAMLQKKKC